MPSLDRPWWDGLRGYAVALAAVAAMVLLRWIIDPLLQNFLPYVTMFGAVAIAVWYGGYRPAAVAAIVGLLFCNYLFVPPRGTFFSVQVHDIVGGVLFLITCGIIILFGEGMRVSQARSVRGAEETRVTLASIGDGVIATDAAGRVTFLNGIAQQLTGWDSAMAQGRPLDEVFRIVNEQTRKEVENPAIRALRDGKIVGLANHTVLISRDGTEFPIDDSAAPIRDEKGRTIGGVLVFRDITVRRRLERQSAERLSSVRLLAAIVESSEDAIVSNSLDGTIQTWNKSAERLFGYTAEQAIGRPIAIIIPEDRRSEEEQIVARWRRGERVEHFDTERQRSNGERVPVSLTISPIRDEAGQVIGASKIARDITERRRTEELLRESEQRFRHMADAAPVLIWVSGTDKLCTWFNKQWLEFVGRPMEQELGNGWAENVHAEDFDRCLQIYTTSFDARRPFAMEYRLRRHDGEYRWVLENGMPSFAPDGTFTGYIGSCVDITDHKRAMETTAAAMLQLQIVTDTMSAAVTRCSRDFRYLWVSRTYADWLGRRPEELNGAAIADVLGGSAFARLRAHFDVVLAGREVEYEEEVEFRGIGRRWVHAVYSPTTDASGSVDGWVALVMDVTDRRRMEESLRDADRRKDEFLATLAHELRNPLAPLRHGVELLRHADGKPVMVEQARSMMDRQLTHLVRLVDDLLEASRLVQGKFELRLERVELASVIHLAVEASRSHIEDGGHELTIVVPPKPIYLNADPTRLSQIVSNLLNNAAKFTPHGGQIWLTAGQEGHEAVLSVRDTGVGISPRHLPHIFKMFSQVEPARDRSRGGLGIGLSLVKGLVEMHGGKVEARSSGSGQGSEFIVRLPTVEAPAPVDASAPGSGSTRPQQSLRILVVDDNRDAAESLARLLEFAGHRIELAHDGFKAVEIATVFRPEVVLLDIGLPKMNGYEVARRIRELDWGKSTTLIALTGWGHDEDKRQALEAGFNHHLTKPADIAELERLLAGVKPV